MKDYDKMDASLKKRKGFCNFLSSNVTRSFFATAMNVTVIGDRSENERSNV